MEEDIDITSIKNHIGTEVVRLVEDKIRGHLSAIFELNEWLISQGLPPVNITQDISLSKSQKPKTEFPWTKFCLDALKAIDTISETTDLYNYGIKNNIDFGVDRATAISRMSGTLGTLKNRRSLVNCKKNSLTGNNLWGLSAWFDSSNNIDPLKMRDGVKIK